MEKPHFPIVIFLAALFRDSVLDVVVFFATLLLIPFGWLLGVFIGFVYMGIFWLWFMTKPVSIQKRLVTRFMLRIGISVVISFIPLLRLMIPENALLVYFTYRDEKKEWEKYKKQQQKSIESNPPRIKRGRRVRATA